MTGYISEARPATLLKEIFFFMAVSPVYHLCELTCSGCDSIIILTACPEMSLLNILSWALVPPGWIDAENLGKPV